MPTLDSAATVQTVGFQNREENSKNITAFCLKHIRLLVALPYSLCGKVLYLTIILFYQLTIRKHTERIISVDLGTCN